MTIFERLGLKEDAGAEEVTKRIGEMERECNGKDCDDCSLSFTMDDGGISTDMCICSCAEGWAIILKEIELRGERKMWEQLRAYCPWRKSASGMCYNNPSTNGWPCNFDTCPLRQ